MSLLKWHVCVCSVLLCISVRSAAASQLDNPASQSISQAASLALTVHLSLFLSHSASLCLCEPPSLAPACYIKPFHLADFSKLLCMLAFSCH